MFLNDRMLQTLCENVIPPLISPMPNMEQIQPASIDLRLGGSFVSPEDGEFVTDDGFPLKPGQFLLGTTWEYVSMPVTHIGFVVGRSSWARLGLQIECAGLVDPGFQGELTLEMHNMSSKPIMLTPGDRICQLAVAAMASAPSKPYGGPGSHYQGQRGATPSVLQ